MTWLLLLQFIHLPANLVFPAEAWMSPSTRALADNYYSCRRHNVEGALTDETEAGMRATIAGMIYDQRVNCRRYRARLLAGLDADARRHRRRPGEAEFVLDRFERNIDARIQSMFSWIDPSE